MGLFKRHTALQPSSDQRKHGPLAHAVDWAKRRRPPHGCAGCKRILPPYVYIENEKEYCLDCAKLNLEVLRLFPAGKRADDITLQDLLKDMLRDTAPAEGGSDSSTEDAPGSPTP